VDEKKWAVNIRFLLHDSVGNLKVSPVRSPTASGALNSVMEQFKITAVQTISFHVDQHGE